MTPSILPFALTLFLAFNLSCQTSRDNQSASEVQNVRDAEKLEKLENGDYKVVCGEGRVETHSLEAITKAFANPDDDTVCKVPMTLRCVSKFEDYATRFLIVGVRAGVVTPWVQRRFDRESTCIEVLTAIQNKARICLSEFIDYATKWKLYDLAKNPEVVPVPGNMIFESQAKCDSFYKGFKKVGNSQLRCWPHYSDSDYAVKFRIFEIDMKTLEAKLFDKNQTPYRDEASCNSILN